MKYPKIQSLVPEGEFFDESALVHEGGYLSVNHLNAIEAHIYNQDEAHNAIIGILKEDLENTNARLQTIIEAEKKASLKITEQENAITALNATVAELSKGPSGTGSSAIATNDELTENEIPSYLSDSNPSNAWADKHIRRRK